MRTDFIRAGHIIDRYACSPCENKSRLFADVSEAVGPWANDVLRVPKGASAHPQSTAKLCGLHFMNICKLKPTHNLLAPFRHLWAQWPSDRHLKCT